MYECTLSHFACSTYLCSSEEAEVQKGRKTTTDEPSRIPYALRVSSVNNHPLETHQPSYCYPYRQGIQQLQQARLPSNKERKAIRQIAAINMGPFGREACFPLSNGHGGGKAGYEEGRHGKRKEMPCP